MLPLTRIQSLSRLSKHKSAQFISRNAHKKVLVWSAQWGAYWREMRVGYTSDPRQAGIYSLLEAYEATSHCGPEKQIFFEFLRSEPIAQTLNTPET